MTSGKFLRFCSIITLILAFVTPIRAAEDVHDEQPEVVDAQCSLHDLHLSLQGPLGRQVQNVVNNWTLRAPQANPALLSVFELRERTPQSDAYYVPWVGEFVGKYLLSASELTQMTESQELRQMVDAVTDALIKSQDVDGYLGPFPKEKRLMVGWDLWGHFHAIAALLDVYERQGRQDALDCAKRAGDLICDTFHYGDARPKDVGSDEMNLAALYALLKLYQYDRQARYLETANVFLDDLQDCGDFYRAGLAGTEFYATPRPRWESLHTIIALSDMARIEQNVSYRSAFLNLCESIRARDVHCNGSFTCGEQAVGAPWRYGAIETCCTVAWIAMAVEALHADGDARFADELENSLFNAVQAYAHPSGSWNTYDTPLNGRREASFHTINFQSRPGQPELNCCSVNGPRGFAEMVNWALTTAHNAQGQDALCLNYYGPMTATFSFDGAKFELTQETEYPYDDTVCVRIKALTDYDKPLIVKFRVPGWSQNATARIGGQTASETPLPSGKYFQCALNLLDGQAQIDLRFPMPLRAMSCDDDFLGRVCLFRGPVLLAYDQTLDAFETDDAPTITPEALQNAQVTRPSTCQQSETLIGKFQSNLLVTVPATNHDGERTTLSLCDFASAGARGSSYLSTLPASDFPPPAPICVLPHRGQGVPPGAVCFARAKSSSYRNVDATVVIAEDPEFEKVVLTLPMGRSDQIVATPEQTEQLQCDVKRLYYWKIIAKNSAGQTQSLEEPRTFWINDALPPFDYQAYLVKTEALRSEREIIVDALAGAPQPTVGAVLTANKLTPAMDANLKKNTAIEFNGVDSELTYELDAFPCVSYEASIEFTMDAPPTPGNIAQIISAWHRGMDDPLRLAINDQGEIYAAVEGSRSGKINAGPLVPGQWYAAKVVKDHTRLLFYLDNKLIGEFNVEERSHTDSLCIGLGCNPKFRNAPEFFNGRLKNFRLNGVSEL